MVNEKIAIPIAIIHEAVLYCPFCEEELLKIDLEHEKIEDAINFIQDHIDRDDINCDLPGHWVCLCDDCKAKQFGEDSQSNDPEVEVKL